MEQICRVCGRVIDGRSDKIYCSDSCRSSFHNQLNRAKPLTLFQQIDRQLKLNRRILKKKLSEPQAVVNRQDLLEIGFNPHYFTHYHRLSDGTVYLYVYEYGFLPSNDQGEVRYHLVQSDPMGSE